MVLWALHSSDRVKRKERLVWCPSSRSEGTLQMSRPAGERTAPFGPSSSWKRSAEPSGSDAANWKTKFSPANVRRLLWGRWKLGGSLTEDRGAKESWVCTTTTNHHSYSHLLVHSSFSDKLCFLSWNKLFTSEHGLAKTFVRAVSGRIIVNTHVLGWRRYDLFFPTGALSGHFKQDHVASTTEITLSPQMLGRKWYSQETPTPPASFSLVTTYCTTKSRRRDVVLDHCLRTQLKWPSHVQVLILTMWLIFSSSIYYSLNNWHVVCK